MIKKGYTFGSKFAFYLYFKFSFFKSKNVFVELFIFNNHSLMTLLNSQVKINIFGHSMETPMVALFASSLTIFLNDY